MKFSLSIKVTEKEKLRIKQVAKERNKTPSDLMREALDLVLSDPELTSQESCYTVAEDLFNYSTKSLPADLASNKEHLRGFGG
jgi:predicted transcriptional regulator